MAGKNLGTAYVEIDLDASRYIRSQQRLYKDATSTSLKIEENFKKLGIKSSAEFDLMRAKITNSYNMIKNSSQATSNDILRAEKAKAQQLKRINEQQFGVQTSLLDKLKKNWLATTAVITAAWLAIRKIVTKVGDVVMSAARYETLGVVMETIGHNAGYTAKQMAEFEQGLQKAGIAMIESRQALAKMNQAQLDLSKSSELARVAQDAAVIGAINSSEAFSQMVYGIQSANVRVLRTIGINVSFEESYKKVAKQLGRTTDSFTEMEKANIRMNAVLDAGKTIAGTYEASMETAGKQVLSLKRHFDNLKVLLGALFTPAFAEIIEQITEAIKGINKELGGDSADAIQNWGIKFRMTIIDIEAAIMSLGIALDKLGKGMTWIGMAVTGPGSALGIESSEKRFEHYAQMNLDLEARALETKGKMMKLAEKRAALERSMMPEARARARAAKEEAEKWMLLKKLAGDTVTEIHSFEEPKISIGAGLESELSQFQASQQTALADLKSQYSQSLINLEDYYSKRKELLTASFEKEKDIKQKLAEGESDIDKKQKTLDNIFVLEQKYEQDKIALAEEENKAIQKHLDDQLNASIKVRDKILEYTSDSIQKQITQVQRQAGKELAEFKKMLDNKLISLSEYTAYRLALEQDTQNKINEITENAEKKNEENLDKMTEFAAEAARNMENAMSTFFFDLMQGKMDDLVGDFKKMIDKMVADMLSSQLSEWLFGSMGKGEGGSWGAIGKIGSKLGGFLGFQHGGWINEPVVGIGQHSGKGYRMGEAGPEYISPEGAISVVNHFNISAPEGRVPRESMNQLQVAVGAGMQKALRRNG